MFITALTSVIDFIFQFTYDKFGEMMMMGRTIWSSHSIVLLLQKMNFQEKIVQNICILGAKFARRIPESLM